MQKLKVGDLAMVVDGGREWPAHRFGHGELVEIVTIEKNIIWPFYCESEDDYSRLKESELYRIGEV